jgi:hypothetical protein
MYYIKGSAHCNTHNTAVIAATMPRVNAPSAHCNAPPSPRAQKRLCVPGFARGRDPYVCVPHETGQDAAQGPA